MNFDPATATLADTPIALYGVEDVSRPIGAALLGLSVKGLTHALDADRMESTGRCHKRVALSQIEAVSGRTVSVHDYLVAYNRNRTSPQAQDKDTLNRPITLRAGYTERRGPMASSSDGSPQTLPAR